MLNSINTICKLSVNLSETKIKFLFQDFLFVENNILRFRKTVLVNFSKFQLLLEEFIEFNYDKFNTRNKVFIF